jgi:hypothetical protein
VKILGFCGAGVKGRRKICHCPIRMSAMCHVRMSSFQGDARTVEPRGLQHDAGLQRWARVLKDIRKHLITQAQTTGSMEISVRTDGTKAAALKARDDKSVDAIAFSAQAQQCGCCWSAFACAKCRSRTAEWPSAVISCDFAHYGRLIDISLPLRRLFSRGRLDQVVDRPGRRVARERGPRRRRNQEALASGQNIDVRGLSL